MKTFFFVILTCFVSNLGFAQIFQDNVGNETTGEFPSKWDVVAGMANVDQVFGSTIISIMHGGIIKPIVNGQTNNYLAGDFTLEFDAYFDRATNMSGQRLVVRLWNGQYGYSKDKIRYQPFNIARHGLKTSWSNPEPGSSTTYKKELETLEPVWRHIKFEIREGKLKIYMDDLLMLQYPKFKMQPTMVSIGAGINESKFKDTKLGIANVNITALGKLRIGETEKNEPNSTEVGYRDDLKDLSNNGVKPSPTGTNALLENGIDLSSNNNVYTFPKNDGTPGQILRTNGYGIVNWVDLPNGEIKTPININTDVIEVEETKGIKPIDIRDANLNNRDILGDIRLDSIYKNTSLVAIDEGKGIGWRLIGRDSRNYGDIGLNAVDLSFSNKATVGATGNYSSAFGTNTIASGTGSTAMGTKTTAFGVNSFAMGLFSTASGVNSFAIGLSTIARGDYSTTFGENTKALSNYSFAAGLNSEASGVGAIAMGTHAFATNNNSISIGTNTLASGLNATAFGNGTKAMGNNSTAMGTKTTAGNNATSIGNLTKAMGDNSTAMGDETTASGVSSIAMGTKTTASGVNTFAMGLFSTAYGVNAFAVGLSTVARGDYSTTFGENTKALSNYSFASGLNSEASGVGAIAMGAHAFATSNNSISIGTNTMATGLNAIAFGNGTKAKGNYSTAMGNKTTAGLNATAMGNSTKAMGDNSTAMGFYTKAESSKSTAIGSYNIGGGDPLEAKDTDPLFEIGNGKSDNNRSNAFTVFNNGNATLAGTLSQNSDKRLKQDIVNLGYGLQEILALRPVSYHWKTNPEAPLKSLGLIAQEVQLIVNEIVRVGKDKDQTLSVSYTELIPVLIKAIQEQQTIIDIQEKKIASLSFKQKEKDEVLIQLSARIKQIESLLNANKL